MAAEPLAGGSLVAVVLAVGVTALLTLLMGWLGRAGKLRPNQFFGIRTSRTLADEKVWYHVHRKSAGWAIGAGGVGLVGTLGLVALSDGAAQATVLIATLCAYTALIGLGAWLAQRGA